MVKIIVSYKNRIISKDSEFEVYRNLNNDSFSIRQDGLVVAHGDNFIIVNAKAKISESGRQRVLSEQVKNVHAVLVASDLIDLGEIEMDTRGFDELYYDPYTLNNFINKETEEVVYECEHVYFFCGKAFILNNISGAINYV